MAVLRGALGLSLADVRQLRQRMPGEIIRGTAAEVEWLRTLLAEEGFSATTRKVA